MGHFFTKRALFFFGSDKFGLYFKILGNNLAKLKDRQTLDIAIGLIVANAFRTMVRINRTRKADESLVFTIIIKGYLCRILKNQFQSNIARYSFKMPKTDITFLDATGYYS